jgi:hypothetical protein
MTGAEFVKDFHSHFCPQKERTTVVMKLKTRQYYQNKHNVEEHIDKFEELVDISQYRYQTKVLLEYICG